MVRARSDWNQKEKLLTTQISGDAAIEDVKRWEASLQKSLEEISDNGVFKIFINLDGFKAVNFEVHKAFREIISRTLANFGWRVGYLDMFPEASVELKSERGIVCKAAVHLHHDETKITNYDKNYSRQNERFFTDVYKAKAWIDNYKIV